MLLFLQYEQIRIIFFRIFRYFYFLFIDFDARAQMILRENGKCFSYVAIFIIPPWEKPKGKPYPNSNAHSIEPPILKFILNEKIISMRASTLCKPSFSHLDASQHPPQPYTKNATELDAFIHAIAKCLQYIQIFMPKKPEKSTSKRKYARISLRKRKQLVKMINIEGQSIAASIKKLKIKLTTARLILQKYKITGTFPMRKFKKVGKMMLDLPQELIKQEPSEGESSGEYLEEQQGVKAEFQGEQGMSYVVKVQEVLDNSSYTSGGGRKAQLS